MNFFSGKRLHEKLNHDANECDGPVAQLSTEPGRSALIKFIARRAAQAHFIIQHVNVTYM